METAPTDTRLNTLRKTLHCIARALVFAPLLLGFASNALHAREQATALEHDPEQHPVSSFDSVLG